MLNINNYKYKEPEMILTDMKDVEEWRQKVPMDYISSIQLAVSSGEEGYFERAWDIIYNISRLYIPDRLYKYCSLTNNKELNEQKLNTLVNDRIYMSNVIDLNDPFDNKAYFFDTDILNELKYWNSDINTIFKDLSSALKVCSLTKNGVSSMPMWAHYANNHKGYCIEYDMNDNRELKSLTFPVQYTSERLNITSFIKQYMLEIDQMIKKRIDEQLILKRVNFFAKNLTHIISYLCNVKHDSWSYEGEYRCTTGAQEIYSDYVMAKPKVIYIGMKCTDEYKTKLINIANKKAISIYQMGFNDFDSAYILPTKEIV